MRRGDFQTLPSGAPAADPAPAIGEESGKVLRGSDASAPSLEDSLSAVDPRRLLSLAAADRASGGPAHCPTLDSGRVMGSPLVSDIPVRSEGARRGSLPTLDGILDPAQGGVRPVELRGPLSHLHALPLGVTDEHPGRYFRERADVELGRGGIGRVFVARDRHLGRDVAIKELLLPEYEGEERPGALATVARFLREARITGQLDHPNIVPVYELGQRADGSLYYSMRVVRGRTLTLAIASKKTLTERLRLLDHFIGLCQAIAYAHSHGVVHRDIKPDNVMIGEFGETVVLDWGMAKARGADAHDLDLELGALPRAEPSSLDLTLDGSLCGTPTHMSPEQVRGRVHEIDERSDVWALGVVLYTVLAGEAPFQSTNLLQLIQRVRDGEFRPLTEVDARIPAELAAIVTRALQVDRSLRYADASEVLREMEAYRSGARVSAHAYSVFELAKRFLARHRSVAITSSVGFTVAVVLAIASYVRLAAARDRALQAETRATLNEKQARRNESAAKHSLSEVLVERAQQAISDGDGASAELLAIEALSELERPDARGLVIAAQSSFRPEPKSMPMPSTAGCARARMSSAAGLLACARGDGISVFGLRDGEDPRLLEAGGNVSALEFSGDGRFLVAALSEGELVLFRLADPGKRPALVRKVGAVSAVAVADGGKYLALGSASGGVLVWDAERPAREWRLPFKQAVTALGFGLEGKSLVIGGDLGHGAAWDFEKGNLRELSGHTGTVRALAFAKQGRYVATGSSDRSIRFWDLKDGTQPVAPLVYIDSVTALDWSADARVIAFGSKDKTVHVQDLKSSSARATLRYHDEPVDVVSLAPDSRELISLSREIGVARWSLESLHTPTEIMERGNVLSLAYVPFQTQLLAGGLGPNGIGIFDLQSGVCLTRLPAGIERVRALAVSPNGKQVAFGGSGSRVFLWDLAARIPLQVFEDAGNEVRAVAFSRDGQRFAYAGLDKKIRIVDVKTLQRVAELDAGAPLQALSFSRDQTLVSGDRDGGLRAWDVAGNQVLRIRAHNDWVLGIDVSTDAKRIASVGGDRKVRVWELSSGKLTWDLAGHEGKVLSVSFSPDGRLLASGSDDKSVRLWDLDAGHEVALLRVHDGAVRSLRFRADGQQLATASDDGTMRLLRLDALGVPPEALRGRVEHRYGLQLSGTRVVRALPPQ